MTVMKYLLKFSQFSEYKESHRERLRFLLSIVGIEVKVNRSLTKWFPRDYYAIDSNEDMEYEENEYRRRLHHANQLAMAAEMEREYSSEELVKSFTPEDICLQESSNAYEYRMHEIFGIHEDVNVAIIDEWIQRMNRFKTLKIDHIIHLRKFLKMASHVSYSIDISNLTQVIKVLMHQLHQLQDKLNTAMFIFDRLVQAPWNTTEAFVGSVLDKDKLGVMDVIGHGDPSGGNGDGFAFKRLVKPQTRSSNPTALSTNSRIQGTGKDLRALTSDELIRSLTLLGVEREQLSKLKRWDLVHLFRDLTNKAAAEGKAHAFEKYVLIDCN